MRDIALTVVIVVLLAALFRHPVMGAYLWAWLSLMNPHQMTYGFARQVGYAQIVAIATMVVFVFTKQKQAPPATPITLVWAAFVLWMSFTSIFALNDGSLVLDRWIFVIKIQVMMAVTIMLVVNRAQLDVLIWVVTLSIAFFGIKGGIFTVLTGGSYHVWGPTNSMVESNNSLAVALVMLVPFMYYLHQVSTRWWVRWGLVFGIASTCFSILGSQSRGALLAVVAMAFFLALKSRHRVRLTLGLAVLLGLAVAFMPDAWVERMDTIREYQGESSAMSRVYSWTTLWNLALDRPIVGGGFRSDSVAIFELYRPRSQEFDIFSGQSWVAHSIYFQTLGEHGFVGFGLFVLLGVLTWRRAGMLARRTAGDPEFGHWVPVLMSMVQVSLVGFAVGGAFLSLAYFDLPYYIVAYVVMVDAMVRSAGRQRRAGAAASLDHAAARPVQHAAAP